MADCAARSSLSRSPQTVQTDKERKQYSEDEQSGAVEAYESGAAWASIDTKYPTVLERIIRRRASEQRAGAAPKRTGPLLLLPTEIEEDFSTWVVGMQGEGFPVTRDMLLKKANAAYCVLYGPTRSTELLGEGWIKRFFGRHPQLALRAPQVISRARNQIEQEGLDLLVNQLIKHAVERKLTGDRVFNMDETGFGQSIKPKKVVAVRGSKNVTGLCFPPLILLPGLRLNRDVLNECSVAGAAVAVAPKAFMNQAPFVKWLEHFDASVPSHVVRPLLLIYDDCVSHHNEAIVQRAVELKIILLLLPPNAAHILQPLDVAVFKPFKTSLKRAMDCFMVDEGVTSLAKKQAISLASQAWENGVVSKPENVISGFAATGIWPISGPKMRAWREHYAKGGVSKTTAGSNPAWLTAREELRASIFFLPKPAAKNSSKRQTVGMFDRIMTQEQLQQI